MWDLAADKQTLHSEQPLQVRDYIIECCYLFTVLIAIYKF